MNPAESGKFADAFEYGAMPRRQAAEIAVLREALERTLSWLTSYPGGGTLGPKGPFEQARAALEGRPWPWLPSGARR